MLSAEDSVVDANPISYFLPPQLSSTLTSTPLSSTSTDDFSLMYPMAILDDDDDDTALFSEISTLSLFPETSENPSEPTFSLFPEVSTVLCLSLPGTPSTIISQDSSASSNNASGNCAPKRLHNLSLFPELLENLGASKPIANNNPPPPHPPSSTSSSPSTALCLSPPSTPDTSSTIMTLQCSIGSQDSSSSGNCGTKRSLFQESTNDPKRQCLMVGEEGHWITKKLTKSDVNGASRLLLRRQEVKSYILPFLNEEQQAIVCQGKCGIDVTVFDLDTQTEHILTLKKWATNNFQLVKAWTTEFVKRRNLKQDDVIAIRWEKNNSRFCFRVEKRHQETGV
ncbi:uncharacterized serine-rich protein C215.13-like [Lycium barbarum]|uniref:uncharacterized serine-rich protein C215.13-like n=1 Tax=Lycium barbarum TaxID=112863 RepID=UPI00293E3337|nr:uncharacterized serine-rich protein C215.13-like [Lycium barbarum]